MLEFPEEMVDLPDETPVLGLNDRVPITLTGEALSSLTARVRDMIDTALGDKQMLDSKIQRWRHIFQMIPPQPPFEGAMTVTTPAARQKIDGIRAHIKSSLNRRPFFTALAATPEAQDAVTAFESVMQSELDNTSSLQAIDYAIDDAVIAGTGIIKLVVESGLDDELYVSLRHVPIEHIYVYPNARLPKHQLTFIQRYWKAYWELEQEAALGFYDIEAVRNIRNVQGAMPGKPGDESPQSLITLDNKLFELYEIWLRVNGELYAVHFHYPSNTILAAAPNPYSDIADEPPFTPVYIDPDPLSFWGRGIAETLEALQDVADAAVNNELWAAQYKMRPPVLVKNGSRLAKTIKQQGGLFPGQILTYEGGVAEETLSIPQYAINPFNMQILGLVGQMVEDSILPDMIVPGAPPSGRRTAAEISMLYSTGSVKLVSHLHYVRHALEAVARVYWRAIAHYRINSAMEPFMPRGVYTAYGHPSKMGRFYLALQDVDIVYRTQEGPMRIRIFGALRPDIRWVVSGDSTQPEREMRVQRFMQVANPSFFQMMDMARNDRGKWHILRRFLEAIGLGQDVHVILGEEPTEQSMSDIIAQGLAQGVLGGSVQKPNDTRAAGAQKGVPGTEGALDG